MKEIPLTKGKVALIDDEDFELVSRYRWHAWKAETCRSWYAHANTTTEQGRRTMISMHRLILRAGPGQATDHENLNGLDNRRHNLRFCNKRKNAANRVKVASRPCTSRFKGVCWHRAARRWVAQIQVNGRKIYIGWFESEIHAARAHDAAAQHYFGEFARLNFPIVEFTHINSPQVGVE